jgi:hypothetical protein
MSIQTSDLSGSAAKAARSCSFVVDFPIIMVFIQVVSTNMNTAELRFYYGPPIEQDFYFLRP